MTQEKALAILKKGGNVFLTGEPGSGKTHTINRYTEWLDGQGIRYAVTASTGIAATHINGQTIHSWSKIGIKTQISARQIETILSDEYAYSRLVNTKVLIIDEVSMLDAQFIADLNALLCTARNTLEQKPFGGIQLVLVGDFYQLPPVNKERKSRFAFESESWAHAKMTVCYLHEQHRQSDLAYLSALAGMRKGETADAKELFATRLIKNLPKVEIAKIKTRLFTHNADVDHLNDMELAKVHGEAKTYRMRETGHEFLVGKLKENCLSPEVLELKVGATVMFTRNNFDDGYVNGTLGVVTGYNHDGWPVVESKSGERYTAKPAEWSFEEYGVVKASISQVPLKLAWAITVHKSQGMSLDEAIVDLSKTFEYGQGYVALSRVRSLQGLVLEGINDKAFEMHPVVVEFDKILRRLSSESISEEAV